MSKTRYFRALAGVATVAAVVCAGGAAYAAAAGRPAVVVTGPDHQRLTFTLKPGASKTFTLPAANDPIRVDIAEPSTNGGVQTPSEVFSALVNVDKNGAGMSWIGTSSDGSQSAGSTISSTDITNLTCGAGCTIASLNAGSVSSHTVVLQTNAATSVIPETYVVNIWY
jgi:hypothetical protein